MKTSKRIVGPLGCSSLLTCSVIVSGCAGPITKTSKYMTASPAGPASAPPGKTLVCIHRPKEHQGWIFYTKIWDGTNFVADLGNGHSTGYVCDPGRHYFINRSIEISACVEADLLADETYDLWLDNAGLLVPSFKIKPLRQDERKRRAVPKWTGKHRWVEPASSAAVYEQEKQDGIEQLREEFISESRLPRMQQLAPNDHR